MTKRIIILASLITIVALLIASRRLASNGPDGGSLLGSKASIGKTATQADLLIQRAQVFVDRLPSKVEGYNLLASAYLQKARETGDFEFNAKAGLAIERAIAIDPKNFDAATLKARLLVTRHEFTEALEAARQAQTLRPDNPDVYGVVADALVELGDYRAALDAGQEMMDLRPDTGSYARAAYLRALHGDTEGAIEAMSIATRAANPRDLETVAWCEVQLGGAMMNAGRLAEAERAIDHALEIFPGYHLALAAKARARVAAGDYDLALQFYNIAQERAPLADIAMALGDLYTRLGRGDEAKRQYDLVEFIEQSGSRGNGGSSRELALFWADRGMNLDEALEIARRERAVRSDIYTCDTLAWCLFKKGEVQHAQAAMADALRLGTRDSRLYYHAGMICDTAGERAKAEHYLKLALKTRGSFDNSNASFETLNADKAKRALTDIAFRVGGMTQRNTQDTARTKQQVRGSQ